MIDAITLKGITDEMRKSCWQEELQESLTLKSCLDISPGNPFESINKNTETKRLVGVLFCNPNTSFCKREITDQLNYFHFRSDKNINIFCCGFGADWPANKYSDQKIATEIDGKKWNYSDQAFIQLVRGFEEKTDWEYSGENELILLDIIPDLDNDNASIVSAIVCNLERMNKDSAFTSVRAFIEDIIRYASIHDSPNIGAFSDLQGLNIIHGTLKDVILSLLPDSLRESYNKAESFVVKKI